MNDQKEITEAVDGFVLRLDTDGGVWVDSHRIAPEMALALYCFFMRSDVADWCEHTLIEAEAVKQVAQ